MSCPLCDAGLSIQRADVADGTDGARHETTVACCSSCEFIIDLLDRDGVALPPERLMAAIEALMLGTGHYADTHRLSVGLAVLAAHRDVLL